jgi:hypothetical protein
MPQELLKRYTVAPAHKRNLTYILRGASSWTWSASNEGDQSSFHDAVTLA